MTEQQTGIFVIESCHWAEWDWEVSLEASVETELGYFTSFDAAAQKVDELDRQVFQAYDSYLASRLALRQDEVGAYEDKLDEYRIKYAEWEILKRHGYDNPEPKVPQLAKEKPAVSYDDWVKNNRRWFHRVLEIKPAEAEEHQPSIDDEPDPEPGGPAGPAPRSDD